MDYIIVENLTKTFGQTVAVNNISFSVKQGEILTLLGPSGCGKTTTLRCIAGLEIPDNGIIKIDNRIVTSINEKYILPPEARNIGMVFQSYAIWPHMTVFGNVAYGLKMKKESKKNITKRVEKTLDMVGLSGLENRPATKLSGGQQQRVALARALVYNPKVLLFDEPLSNLDAKLRERTRLEILRLQKEMAFTSIYVTHDQAEAMAISDRIVVMNEGKIEQVGDPRTLYKSPTSKFIADFIGSTNLLEVTVLEKGSHVGTDYLSFFDGKSIWYKIQCKLPNTIKKGEQITVCVRPEDINLYDKLRGDKRNILQGKVGNLVYLGNLIDYRIKVGTKEFRVQRTEEELLKKGDEVFLEIPGDKCIHLSR